MHTLSCRTRKKQILKGIPEWHNLFDKLHSSQRVSGTRNQNKILMEAKNLIGGLIVGAAMGVAAGLLLAPRSGEQTRRKLVKGSLKIKKEFQNNIVNYIDESVDSLRDQLNEKIDLVAKRGKDTINHVSERVKI